MVDLEKKRRELEELIKNNIDNLTKKDVVKLSQELDKLIVILQKKIKQNL
ncbi:aspartyl-phosphate phosphatase Spo0E family protein [Wukongibacter baidiensis]